MALVNEEKELQVRSARTSRACAKIKFMKLPLVWPLLRSCCSWRMWSCLAKTEIGTLTATPTTGSSPTTWPTFEPIPDRR
jgi:hypothetical protein